LTKRTIDVLLSAVGLVMLSPVFLAVAALIWLYDRRNPFYVARRIGVSGASFAMVKFRTMDVNADSTGVTSTGAADTRITPIGRLVRRHKLDELPQLVNVMKGEMSLVGPRPNVPSEVALYTDAERQILTVRPGITDLASIVFADEGEILRESCDPDLDYNRLIRPWKSRLALFYVAHQSLLMDAQIAALTLRNIVNRDSALAGVSELLTARGADEALRLVASRRDELVPTPPPGASEPVTHTRRAAP